MSGIIEFSDGEIKAGDGNDDVSIAAGLLWNRRYPRRWSRHADLLRRRHSGYLTGSSVLGGSGADEISLIGDADLSATTVFGGGGADLITISGTVGGESQINADSTANGGGADTINLTGNGVVSATVKGKGGADEIIISGALGNSARVEGNAGADLIILSGGFAALLALLVLDQVTTPSQVFTGITNSANTIKGGGGTDSISFIGGGVVGGMGSGTMIYGGAGADTIELGTVLTGGDGAAAGAASGYVALEALSDSSIDAIDVVSATLLVSGLYFAVDTAAGITSFTVGVYNDSDTTTPSITAGVVSGATWASADSTVTSRATDLDGLLDTKGTIIGFTAGTENYLHPRRRIRYSDDAVINVSEALSGASFEVANDYEFYVGFEATDHPVSRKDSQTPHLGVFFCL